MKGQDFLEKIETVTKNNIIFTNPLNTKVRFNLSKQHKNITSSNKFLGFVNGLFEDYNIKITQKRVMINYVNDTIYSLSIINDINELLEYKIKLGFNLYDEQSMRKPSTSNTYANLIDKKKMETVQIKIKSGKKNETNCTAKWRNFLN